MVLMLRESNDGWIIEVLVLGHEAEVKLSQAEFPGKRDYLVKDEPVTIVAKMWRSSEWKLEGEMAGS